MNILIICVLLLAFAALMIKLIKSVFSDKPKTPFSKGGAPFPTKNNENGDNLMDEIN